MQKFPLHAVVFMQLEKTQILCAIYTLIIQDKIIVMLTFMSLSAPIRNLVWTKTMLACPRFLLCNRVRYCQLP